MRLKINGKRYRVSVPKETPLLWVLRDVIGLTGTKYGCGIERCGACTVLIDGEPKRSCDVDVTEAKGREVTTIEGLSRNPDKPTHPLQRAWIKNEVPQCGYCQSGMLMAAAGELKKHRNPSEVVNELDNICVCGTYQRIRTALNSL